MRQFGLKLLVELVNCGGGAVLTQVALLFQALVYQSLCEFKLRETKRYDVRTEADVTKNHFHYPVSMSA